MLSYNDDAGRSIASTRSTRSTRADGVSIGRTGRNNDLSQIAACGATASTLSIACYGALATTTRSGIRCCIRPIAPGYTSTSATKWTIATSTTGN